MKNSFYELDESSLNNIQNEIWNKNDVISTIDSVFNLFAKHIPELLKPCFISFVTTAQPEISVDRTSIQLTINLIKDYLNQIKYQLTHELTHMCNSKINLPIKIQWFDELLCSSSAFIFCDYNQEYASYLTNLIKTCVVTKETIIERIKLFKSNALFLMSPSSVYMHIQLLDGTRLDNRINYAIFYRPENYNHWKMLKVMSSVSYALTPASTIDDLFGFFDFVNQNHEYDVEINFFKNLIF